MLFHSAGRRPAAATLLALAALTACTQDVTEPERASSTPGISFASASNTWAVRASMPTPRARLKATTVNGIIYAIGGTGSLRKVEAYNTGTNSWSSKASLPEPLEPTGASSINGKIYVAGGRSSSGISKRLYVYNPATNSWTRKADMPYKGTAHGGEQGAINGRLYVYLGMTTKSDGTVGPQRFMRYNPSTNTWSTLPVPSLARVDAVSGVINGRLYLMGGKKVDGSTVFGRAADVHVYNPASGWSKLPLTGSWAWSTDKLAYGTTGGKVYINGGWYSDGWNHVDMVYNPATNTRTNLPASSHFNRQGSAGTGANGQFYVIGGYTCQQVSGQEPCDPEGLSGVVEAYTP
jgi:N-acetylneuraminic acid mutarotase